MAALNNNNKVCVIIQARMSSSRLPEKVLRPINGRPMLSYMIERVRVCKGVDQVILATSLDTSDDAIEKFCNNEGIDCYRGELDDVLDRYYQAASNSGADIVVRLTGDCPLIDPILLDKMINFYQENDFDYVGNTLLPDYTAPQGMDVEIFSFACLEKVWKEAAKPSDREHVTFYFWNNPETFKIGRYNLEKDYSGYRLTVDYPEDLEVIKTIITKLYPQDKLFSMESIIQFLDAHPEVREINTDIKPNEGWQSAFDKDREVKLQS